MNNSKLASEAISLSMDSINIEPLKEREVELIRFIEAAERVFKSEDWSTLKKLRFNPLIESLEKQLRIESEKLEINAPMLNQLQGELKWARKYSDLEKLTHEYKIELTKIRNLTK